MKFILNKYIKNILILSIILCSESSACEKWVDGICVDKVIIQTQATDCSDYVDDGWICWDYDDDKLYIGDGTTSIEAGQDSYLRLNGTNSPTATIDFNSQDLINVDNLTATSGTFTNVYVNSGDLYVDNVGLNDTDPSAPGCELIGIPILGEASFTTQCDFDKLFGSSGRAEGGTVIADGTFYDVSGGSGFIKATDSDTAQLLSFNWSESQDNTIDADSRKFVGVKYNSGTPIVESRLTESYDLDTEFSLASVIRENGSLHILNNPWWVTDGMTNIVERLQADGYVIRDNYVGGMIITDEGNRNLSISGGTLWSRLNEHPIAAIDTSATDTIEYYWYNGVAGTWNESDATAWSGTQWNDTTLATLQTINNNYYYNTWVYAEADDQSYSMVYAQAQHERLANAEAETPPTLIPTHIQEHAILIGRIISKQGTVAAIGIESAFDIVFNPSLAADHGNLAGLSDDDHSQYAFLAGRDNDTLSIDQVNAYDAAGLKLYDDGGNGIFIQDGGNVQLLNDSQQLQMGAAGATDYYQMFDGTDAQFYTSGDFIFNNGNLGIHTSNPITALNLGENFGITGGLSFGDGDTGIYESSANSLSFLSGGTRLMQFLSSYIRNPVTNGYYIYALTGNTSSTPTYSWYGDTNTGIGHADPDVLHFITGGVSRLNVTATGDVGISADNSKLLFGVGNDASIYYDGTNMLINPKEVGSGHLEVLGDLIADDVTFADATFNRIYADGNEVDLSDTTDGYVLTFDTATQKWSGAVSGSGSAGSAWGIDIDGDLAPLEFVSFEGGWQIDSFGGLMPATSFSSDSRWELDGNDDLQPTN